MFLSLSLFSLLGLFDHAWRWVDDSATSHIDYVNGSHPDSGASVAAVFIRLPDACVCGSAAQYLIFRVTRGPFVEDFYQCVTYDFYTAKWQEQLYTTFTLIFMFIIPLGILLVTYISTFRTIAGL